MSLTSCTPMTPRCLCHSKHCPNPVWPSTDIGFSPKTSALPPTAELFYYFSIVFLEDKIQKEGSTYLSYAYRMVDGFSPMQLNWLLKLWSVTLNHLSYNTFSTLPAFSNVCHLKTFRTCCAFSLLSSLFHKALVNVGLSYDGVTQLSIMLLKVQYNSGFI